MVKKMADRKLELPEGVPPLMQYYVYLTSGCNLACQHCWITPTYQAHGDTGGHLDYELFALAIEEGLPLGLSNVKLTGGEPLLHPDFIRIVDLLREKELSLVIETNGTLLTESLAQYLKEKSTLSSISISLDGATADTHDPFRGVRGSFEKAVQGIRYLVKNGFRPQVIMSIHSGNVDEIEALVHLSEELGAMSVKFNLIQPVGRGETMIKRNQVLDIQRLIELGNLVENDLQKRTSIELSYSWPMAFYSLRRLITRGGDTCGIFSILGILATGQFAMCGIGVEVPELVYGQLGKDNLEQVWCEHPTLQALRRDLPGNLEGVCGNCILKQKCLGSCVANNYHESGHLTEAFWFCKNAEELGFFPVNRLA
jgi:SynChlorMet cassette radical SAM/SPASM protein ScmF